MNNSIPCANGHNEVNPILSGLAKEFNQIKDDVFQNLDSGGDGCTFRFSNKAYHDVSKILNNEPILPMEDLD